MMHERLLGVIPARGEFSFTLRIHRYHFMRFINRQEHRVWWHFIRASRPDDDFPTPDTTHEYGLANNYPFYPARCSRHSGTTSPSSRRITKTRSIWHSHAFICQLHASNLSSHYRHTFAMYRSQFTSDYNPVTMMTIANIGVVRC